MPSPRTKPSKTSLVAFFLLVTLYAASYFMIAKVEHATTGYANATYPEYVETIAVVFRPMESIDRRVRPEKWKYDREIAIEGAQRIIRSSRIWEGDQPTNTR